MGIHVYAWMAAEPGAVPIAQLGEFVLNPEAGLYYDFASHLYFHPEDKWCDHLRDLIHEMCKTVIVKRFYYIRQLLPPKHISQQYMIPRNPEPSAIICTNSCSQFSIISFVCQVSFLRSAMCFGWFCVVCPLVY